MKRSKIIYLVAMVVCVCTLSFSSEIKAQASPKKTEKSYSVLPAKKATVKKVKEIDKITDFSSVFNPQYYYDRYEDIRIAIGRDEQALLKHFKEHGMQEGRIANPEFNVKAYMLNNLDLVGEMKADDLTEYFAHYIKSGKQEGRIAVYQFGQQPAEGILATYTTYYNPLEMRAVNVELAASRVNGTVLTPGSTFSFSKSVGTRTVANGYVDGPSFAAGKEVTSIGGGICQVSSNLYLAMLLAGIEPIEHHYHSLPVDYVPPKLDAAISENVQDLRFKNNYEYNICIESVAKDGVLTVTLKRG